MSNEIEAKDILNMDFFTNNPPKIIDVDLGDEPVKQRKKRVTKKKQMPDGTEIITNEDNDTEEVNTTPLTFLQSNQPYIDTYQETNNMLRTSVVQIDILQSDIKKELENVTNSKTLKNKYNYITDLVGASSNLISTKITAIREINNIITNSHSFDLKREKELKLVQSEGNDDESIMRLYNNFISRPQVNGNAFSALGMPDLAQLSAGQMPIQGFVKGDNIQGEMYNNYVGNMTPEQNMMLLESNPNVKTVVKYDQSTGNRAFDVIDVTTGMSVPNTSVLDPMFLEDLNINLNQKIAYNNNMGTSYPLVIVQSSSNVLNEY